MLLETWDVDTKPNALFLNSLVKFLFLNLFFLNLPFTVYFSQVSFFLFSFFTSESSEGGGGVLVEKDDKSQDLGHTLVCWFPDIASLRLAAEEKKRLETIQSQIHTNNYPNSFKISFHVNLIMQSNHHQSLIPGILNRMEMRNNNFGSEYS